MLRVIDCAADVQDYLVRWECAPRCYYAKTMIGAMLLVPQGFVTEYLAREL